MNVSFIARMREEPEADRTLIPESFFLLVIASS